MTTMRQWNRHRRHRPLALAVLIGGRVNAFMRRSLLGAEWLRRGLGVAVLAGVAAIATGLDRGYLSQLSLASTSGIEQALVDLLGHRVTARNAAEADVRPVGAAAVMTTAATPVAARAHGLSVEGSFPPLAGAVDWINSPPLTADGLRGKVVLIDFWTYTCIYWIRTLPYLQAWAKKYKDAGLVVIGVHTPEFAFERNLANVRKATKDFGIDYPVAVDSEYAIWRAFRNQYWPAMYFIDAQGQVRHHQFGEGRYERSEQVIQALLAERGAVHVPDGVVAAQGQGVQAAPGTAPVLTPETYVGYDRAEGFVPLNGILRGRPHAYADAPPLSLNQWTLSGDWTVEGDRALLERAHGRIAYRFHARDLHLVLGPADDGKPVRFRVRVDGQPPLADHGADVDAQGFGTVDAPRLYQLIRQAPPVRDRQFEIEFLDPGAQAYAFTFG